MKNEKFIHFCWFVSVVVGLPLAGGGGVGVGVALAGAAAGADSLASKRREGWCRGFKRKFLLGNFSQKNLVGDNLASTVATLCKMPPRREERDRERKREREGERKMDGQTDS